MAIKRYERGAGTQLTANFNQREFDCHGNSSCCKCGCKETLVDTKLIRKLQVLRNRIGVPISINSGYRCVAHNKCQGGASASQHTYGKAADIRCSLSPTQLAKAAQEVGFTGIGRYSNRVHVDTRAVKYYYTVTSTGRELPKSTHGGKQMRCPYALGNKSLRRGSTGTAVRAVQWIINWAGYPCSVDGSFGSKTESALRNFQRDMMLAADGIVGANTRAALSEVAS